MPDFSVDPIYIDLVNSYQKIRLSQHFNFKREEYLSGLYKMELFQRPLPKERLFKYNLILAQTNMGNGAAFCPFEINSNFHEIFEKLIGKSEEELIDFLKILDDQSHYYVKIAILDALYEKILPAPDFEVRLIGETKALYRSDIVINEALSLIYKRLEEGKLKNETPVFLNIGFVSTFNKVLKRKMSNFCYYATDLDKNIVDKVYHGVRIFDGKAYNKDLIKKSDVMIVTGMTLATGTLSNLLKLANKYNTYVVIFAQTGHNLAPFYLNYGADVVVSESFPYYGFHNTGKICVYRKYR